MSKENMGNSHHMDSPENNSPQEFDFKRASFVDLANNARVEVDPVKSKEYLTEIKTRITEAEQAGAINVTELQSLFRNTLDNSTWDNFYDNLVNAGKNYDQESAGTMGGTYMQNPRYANMAEVFANALAKDISATELPNVKSLSSQREDLWTDGDWYQIGQKMRPGNNYTKEQVQNLYNIRKRYAETDFTSALGVNEDDLKRLIDGPTPQQRQVQKQFEDAANNRPEYTQVSQIPLGVGATFFTTIAENMSKQSNAPEGHSVPVIDIRTDLLDKLNASPDDWNKALETMEGKLNDWVLLNVVKFMKQGGSVAGAGSAHLDFYIKQDLKRMMGNLERDIIHGKSGDELKNARKRLNAIADKVDAAEDNIKSEMALASLAIDMEASGGSGTAVFVGQLGATHTGGADTDKVAGSEKRLMSEDEGLENYLKWLQDPHLRPKLNVLYNEMGIGTGTDGEFHELQKNSRSKIISVDKKAFGRSDLARSLFNGGYINGWIEKKIKDEDAADEAAGSHEDRGSYEKRWMEWKKVVNMAEADGKFTWLKYHLHDKVEIINDKGEQETKPVAKMKLSENDDGDPISNILTPSILMRIKNVYTQNPEIREQVDRAFRMEGYLAEDELMPVSFVGVGTKKLVRYNRLIEAASKGPLWGAWADLGKDGALSMAEMSDLMLQINTGRKGGVFKLANGRIVSPDEVNGEQFQRIFDGKVNAALSLTPGQTMFEVIGHMGATPDARTLKFGQAITDMMGPDWDGSGGLWAELKGGQKHFKFSAKARVGMLNAVNKLYYNEQNEYVRVMSNAFNFVGWLIDMGFILVDTTGKAVGADIDLEKTANRSGGRR